MHIGKVIIDVMAILITTFGLTFCFSPRPAPIREQAFIFPVLTGKPSKEHKKIHTVAQKSDTNAIFSVFITISLPRVSIIFPPPATVPSIINIPTITIKAKGAELSASPYTRSISNVRSF